MYTKLELQGLSKRLLNGTMVAMETSLPERMCSVEIAVGDPFVQLDRTALNQTTLSFCFVFW